ncbi:toll-like receptor 13 [Liolophura sinensis]|uniref:toll-like receptor 13 n=1 Tax=Liolophura sinensis TaxID=3198878 RepID=UPI003158D49A
MEVYAFLLGTVLLSAVYGDNHVDLHNKGLRTVPTNISSTTESLDLSWNLLETITNGSFRILSRLISLSLNHNKLVRLEPSAFEGLSQLRFLDLSNNRFVLVYESYPPTVFHPTQKLEILNMDENSPGYSSRAYQFPDEIFSSLISLKKLTVDEPLHNVSFGPGVMSMSQLKSLSVYCWEFGSSLRPDTFAAFANLSIESLVLRCQSLEEGTLKHFPHVTSLNLRTKSLPNALSALVDLRHRHMTYLTITNTNSDKGFSRDPETLALTANNTAHLATICVRHLDLSKNAIIHLGIDVFSRFQYPECLETFNFGNNYLPVATSYLAAIGAIRFTRLKYLNISPGRRYAFTVREVSDLVWTKSSVFQYNLVVPPSLVVLNASFLAGFITIDKDVNFTNGKNVEVLDVSYDGFKGCSFVVTGLENLKVLNISKWNCAVLSPRFFSYFTSLQVLVARNCRLNTGFRYDLDAVIFKSLKHLKTLDLSSNDFTTLSRFIFSPLQSLETLILSNNKLIHIPESIYDLVSLTFLDLSSNVISSLSRAQMDWLTADNSSHSKDAVRVSLNRNPLLCTCNTVSFVRWLLDGSANVEARLTLTCSLGNGTFVDIGSLTSKLKNMEVSCVSNFWLTFSTVGSSLMAVVIVLGIFAYRYRWNIKYWVLTKCRRGSVVEEVTNEQYRYDAFVAYNYFSYRWACIVLRQFLEDENNYTICLHDRDFPVGVSIQQNIVDAVNNSRKVILVINKSFLKSDWCEFEIQMTGMRMVRDGYENAIIVILMEEIPVSEMPRSLLNLWNHITFLLWPANDPGDERIFWNRLLEVMAR